MALGIQISQVVLEFIVSNTPAGPSPAPVCNNPPNGTVGVSYSHTFTATGGTPPYTWSISAGALPNGLSLDPGSGTVSGIPTVAATFNFTVKATDFLGASGTVDCSITIDPAPPPSLGSIRITLRGVKLRPVCEGETKITEAVPQVSKVDRAL